MVPAAMLCKNGPVSPLWLVGVYFLECVGELCLSPVGLSTVTKLAPLRFVGMFMGIWFLASAIGDYLAGKLAGLYDKNPDHLVALFGGMGISAVVATLILVLLTPKIRQLMGGIK
jgi:POT family proton-dependent oligopeptide transporter